ncbi:MAG: hypothetical protein ACLT4Y_09745 [Bifidobacterium breve]
MTPGQLLGQVLSVRRAKDSLTIKTLYDKGYAPTAAQALDANLGTTIANEWLPRTRSAAQSTAAGCLRLDGRWIVRVARL